MLVGERDQLGRAQHTLAANHRRIARQPLQPLAERDLAFVDQTLGRTDGDVARSVDQRIAVLRQPEPSGRTPDPDAPRQPPDRLQARLGLGRLVEQHEQMLAGLQPSAGRGILHRGAGRRPRPGRRPRRSRARARSGSRADRPSRRRRTAAGRGRLRRPDEVRHARAGCRLPSSAWLPWRLSYAALVVMSPVAGQTVLDDAEADRFAEVQDVDPAPNLGQYRSGIGGLDRDGLVFSARHLGAADLDDLLAIGVFARNAWRAALHAPRTG